ncbi:MAG: cell division protein FtsA, partial [Cyclobacteriaceae bacterium]
SGFNKKLAAGIVVTGGGSQLTNLPQLFEYMTGLDTRVGYPNEHLGKSKLDSVKSPMYATTIGLVLSGFRALDIREDGYKEKAGKGNLKVKNKKGAKFFQNIIEKTKDLLIDDLDDKKDY